jgi:small nuclear ribonucleoprotein G
MDRRLFIHIQGGRSVSGILRGFDMFLNLVVDQAYEELGQGQRKPAGMVVSSGVEGQGVIWHSGEDVLAHHGLHQQSHLVALHGDSMLS